MNNQVEVRKEDFSFADNRSSNTPIVRALRRHFGGAWYLSGTNALGPVDWLKLPSEAIQKEVHFLVDGDTAPFNFTVERMGWREDYKPAKD